MGTARSYEPGTPSWVDLGTPDIDGAAAFYGGLFGWQAEDASPGEDAGGYRYFRLGGADIGGLGPQQGPATTWAGYVAVEDVDAAVARVKDLGGTVLAGPIDVFTQGRMAVVADDQGAPISLWQAGDNHGADLKGEPGSFSWIELSCPDAERAKAFYGGVFGWTSQSYPYGEGGTSSYTEFATAGTGNVIAGMVQAPDQWRTAGPAQWAVYFEVADTDATAAKALELGGSVGFEPYDIPHVGRLAVLADPYGAAFTVMTRSREH
jgi:uncharacterized protein